MSETIEELKKTIALYEQNGAVGLYYELNRFVNGTIALMRKNSVESLLKVEKDDDPKKFERMMALIKNAKEHIVDMAEMKSKLKLSGNEEEDNKNRAFVDNIAQNRP